MRKDVFLLSALFLAACSTPQPANENFKVVTSIGPLYSLTANLFEGTDSEVVNLLPSGTSVHSYQLSVDDVIALDEADLIVVNGLELEHFLEDYLEENQNRVLVASEGLDFLMGDDLHCEDGHCPDSYDPHVWLDPRNAAKMSENIYNVIVEFDGENTVQYENNLNDLVARLDSLDRNIVESLADLEIDAYIVFHDAYAYFEEAYGIEAVASVQEFPGDEPSAEYLANLVDLIQSYDVDVAFAEPEFLPKVLESLAMDYDLLVYQLSPLGTEVSKDGYFDMMRRNLNSFKKAFDGR